jgi:hypothetical protein
MSPINDSYEARREQAVWARQSGDALTIRRLEEERDQYLAERESVRDEGLAVNASLHRRLQAAQGQAEKVGAALAELVRALSAPGGTP